MEMNDEKWEEEFNLACEQKHTWMRKCKVLEARLAEVEKAHEAALAKLGNELFKVKEQRDTYKSIAEVSQEVIKEFREKLKLAVAVVEQARMMYEDRAHSITANDASDIQFKIRAFDAVQGKEV